MNKITSNEIIRADVFAGLARTDDVHGHVLSVFNKIAAERGWPTATFEDLEKVVAVAFPNIPIAQIGDSEKVLELTGIPEFLFTHLKGWAEKKYNVGNDTYREIPWDNFIELLEKNGFEIKHLQLYPIADGYMKDHESWVLIAIKDGLFMFADSIHDYDNKNIRVNGYTIYAEFDQAHYEISGYDRGSSSPLWLGKMTRDDENWSGRFHVTFGKEGGLFQAIRKLEAKAGKVELPKYKIKHYRSFYALGKSTEATWDLLVKTGISKYFRNDRDYSVDCIPVEE